MVTIGNSAISASVSGPNEVLGGALRDPKLQRLISRPQALSVNGSPANVDFRPVVRDLTPFVFDPASAPAGTTSTNYTWSMWGHSVIPADERPGTMFVVMAEGSAYQGKPNVRVRGRGRVDAEMRGQIIKIGIPRDYTRRDAGSKGDETDVPITVHGKPGEIVKLRYMRLSIGEDGVITGAGTPDDCVRGASGAYFGRQMAVEIGKPQKIISPEDQDRDYRNMIRYYFDGDRSQPKPDLSRLALESKDRGFGPGSYY